MARFALFPLATLAPFALCAAMGCDSSASPGGGAPSSSSSTRPSPSSAAPPPPTDPPVAAPAPDDLDVSALQKALKCPFDAKSGPCRVLAQFSSCKEWNPVSPSGDARYLGQGFAVENGKTTEIVTIVRSKRAPTSEVAPGQLPAKLGIAELPKEEGAAYDQAGRAIRSYERGDVPGRGSPTLDYLKKRADWQEFYTVRTVGGQVYALTQGGTFVCLGAKQKLLFVQRAGTRGSDGDGLYAELWATSW